MLGRFVRKQFKALLLLLLRDSEVQAAVVWMVRDAVRRNPALLISRPQEG